MDFLKCYVQNIGIFDIITCADNEAVTYFQKQGFNKHEILMDPKRWVGCIKDYDGITLVHCHLRDDIVYPKYTKGLQKQIEYLKRRTKSIMYQQVPLIGNTSSLPKLLKDYINV